MCSSSGRMDGRQSISSSSSIIFRVSRTFARLRLTQVQVESSRVESNRLDRSGPPKTPRLG